MQANQRLMGDRILDLNSNNFLTWKTRIDKLMDNLDFPGGQSTEPTATSSQHREWMMCSAGGAKLIADLCTERLLNQVDGEAKCHHLRLLNELRRLVFYFRFLELPPELRVRIYEYCMPKGEEIWFTPARKPSRSSPDPHYPAITSVCRQIRSESLPLCYSRCLFRLDFLVQSEFCAGRPPDTSKSVNTGKLSQMWAESLSSVHLKHLRQIEVVFHAKGRGGPGRGVRQLRLTYSQERGLRVSSSAYDDIRRLKDNSRVLLLKHIGEVEKMRKMLGLQGESIVMALAGKDEMWRFGTLKYKA